MTSHHITSHHVTSYHITSHHITSHHITSHHTYHITHMTSHTSNHITSHHITSHHTYHITSHHTSPHVYLILTYCSDVCCLLHFAKIATVILFFYSVLLFPFLSTYYYTSIFVLNHYYTNINALCYCRECNEDERGVCAYALKGHCEGR